MKKIIGIILIGLFLVGVGFGIAKLVNREVGGQIEKELTFSVIVTAIGDFEIGISPKNPDTGEGEITIPKGQVGAFTITNTASGGFDAQIQYSVAGLPAGSYSFSINPVAAGQETTLRIDTATMTSNTVYVCSLTASDR